MSIYFNTERSIFTQINCEIKVVPWVFVFHTLLPLRFLV